MNSADLILGYVFATVIQLPFHLIIAMPFLLVAWVVSVVLRKLVSTKPRFLVVSCISAIGLAPAYGFHLSMIPIYTLYLGGVASAHDFIISFLATWGTIVLVGFFVKWYRNRGQPPGANQSFNPDAPKNGAPVN